MTQPSPRFETTQWTIVWNAAKASLKQDRQTNEPLSTSHDPAHSESPPSLAYRPALEEIIHRYWLPLYSFARQQGLSSADAEDATQAFLCQVIEGSWLAKADPAKGRFRTYLLTAWKRFLIDEYRKQNRQKRGGGIVVQSIEFSLGENHFQRQGGQTSSPDESFMVAWANSILEGAKKRLRTELQGRGRDRIVPFLFRHLTQPIQNQDYQHWTTETGCSVAALKVALHRGRQRFGELVRECVLETIEDPAELDIELQTLVEVFRRQI